MDPDRPEVGPQEEVDNRKAVLARPRRPLRRSFESHTLDHKKEHKGMEQQFVVRLSDRQNDEVQDERSFRRCIGFRRIARRNR